MDSLIPDRSIFHKQKHTKYWLRCLKTHLPAAYTPNDSQRITLAFFILSALDLLGALHIHTTPAERTEYATWILRCQHPNGGFRGFTGTMVSENHGSCVYDSANLAATYFALAALVVLGKGMEKVKRRECLEWVRSLQRDNGSIGEGLGKDGKIEGAEDMRFAQLAAGVRWFLRRGEMETVQDIDVEALGGWIEASVTYEGGIAQAPLHEAHAGLTYAGVSALSLLGRLSRKGEENEDNKSTSSEFIGGLTQWLVSRQTGVLHEDEDWSMAEEEPSNPRSTDVSSGFEVTGSYPAQQQSGAAPENTLSRGPPEEMNYVGVNGRCNKVADTCYTFWVGGSLGILHKVYLQDFNGIRRYLLEKTQHMIGGFGKMPGDLPDILHSYTGLAALANMREPELRSLDPTLCISVCAREAFEQTVIPAVTLTRKHTLTNGSAED